MRLVTAIFITLICLSPTASADDPVEVDQAEVMRLGNLVQAVGSGPRSTQVDRYVEAMAPPASDADKWFISVFTTRGCKACEQLKQDWSKDPWLLALANPSDPKASWAHYSVYLQDDRSQAFRFTEIKVTEFPTVIVQPPRSGKYGDPKTVIFQGVPGESPEQLAQAITHAIRTYVASLSTTASTKQSEGASQATVASPPWQPTPREEPQIDERYSRPNLDQLLQLIPPPRQTSSLDWQTLLSLLSAGVSLPTAASVLVWIIYAFRTGRKVTGRPPLLDQANFDRLVELLKAIDDGKRTPPSRPNDT
jgi:thioredoxin-related protein